MTTTDLDLAHRRLHPQQVLERELETERARHLMASLTAGDPDSVARRGELASLLYSSLIENYAVKPIDDTQPETPATERPWEPNFVDVAATLLAAGMMQPATPANVPRMAFERALELDAERRRLRR